MKKNWLLAVVLIVCVCILVACPGREETFIVSLHANNGSEVMLINDVLYGTYIEKPINPTKDGNTFEGWYSDEDLTEKWLFTQNSVTRNLALYAKWKSVVTQTTYTVTFDSNDESEITTITDLPYGTYIEKPINPTKDGNTFEGWYSDEDLTEKWLFTQNSVTKNLTLYAKWSKISNISYVLNGGINSVSNPEYYKQGETVVLINPERYGYEFSGWYTRENFVGSRVYAVSSDQDQNITLYAKWKYQNFNLPIMTIEIDDGMPLSKINKTDYVNTTISVLNNESEYTLSNTKAEFRGRGNYSWTLEKKGYRIKFYEKQGMFGNAASKHWVLVTGQHDTSYMRNSLAYSVVNEALDKIEYTTSVQWVDLYVNGNYHGVYSVFEHIRVDEHRVNIDSEFGVEDTGYLIEYDGYAMAEGEEGVAWFKVNGLKYYFTVKSPDFEDYAGAGLTKEQFKQQVSFIQAYMQRLVDAILTDDYDEFLSLADVDSFVDMYIVHELFKNKDTGWSSFYFYKKPGGKVFCGPTWDFDLTAGLTQGDASPIGLYVSDAVEIHSNATSSEIYIKLMKNEAFKNSVKLRWSNVTKNIETVVESFIADAYQYEDSFNRDLYFWYNTALDWTNEAQYLKNWLLTRIEWLNEEWSIELSTERLMILQAYGTGNKTDGAVSHSFIELYNNTNQDIELDGYTVQFSDGGTNWTVIGLDGKVIKAYSSFLILGAKKNDSAKLQLSDSDADIVADFVLSNQQFKICLVKSTTELFGVNPYIEGISGYVDMLGAYNESIIDAGETVAANVISKQKAARRNSLYDSDNNSADFDEIDYRADGKELYGPRGTNHGAWNPITLV